MCVCVEGGGTGLPLVTRSWAADVRVAPLRVWRYTGCEWGDQTEVAVALSLSLSHATARAWRYLAPAASASCFCCFREKSLIMACRLDLTFSLRLENNNNRQGGGFRRVHTPSPALHTHTGCRRRATLWYCQKPQKQQATACS